MPKKNKVFQNNKKKDDDVVEFDISEAITENDSLNDIDELDLKKENLSKLDGSFFDAEDNIFENDYNDKKKENKHLSDSSDFSDYSESEDFDELDDSSESSDSYEEEASETSILEVVDSQTEGMEQDVILHFYKDRPENEVNATDNDIAYKNEQQLIDILARRLDGDIADENSFADNVEEKVEHQIAYKAEPSYYEEFRHLFNELDNDIKNLRLDSIFSQDTDEYKAMKKSYEELRHLQESESTSVNALAEKFDELQENARIYLEKKSKEKQNNRKLNRMAWAKKIIEIDNRYKLTAAYDVVEKQKLAGNNIIKEAFGDTISREKLAKGVAMHIVANILEKQISSGGIDLNYESIKLITDSNRIEHSINSFIEDKVFIDLINSFTDEKLQKMYTVNKQADGEKQLEIESKTDALLFSERIYKKLLHRINELNHEAENRIENKIEKEIPNNSFNSEISEYTHLMQ